MFSVSGAHHFRGVEHAVLICIERLENVLGRLLNRIVFLPRQRAVQ